VPVFGGNLSPSSTQRHSTRFDLSIRRRQHKFSRWKLDVCGQREQHPAGVDAHRRRSRRSWLIDRPILAACRVADEVRIAEPPPSATGRGSRHGGHQCR
jgi:hypothetical protein